MRKYFLFGSLLVVLTVAGISMLFPMAGHFYWLIVPLLLIGYYDYFQTKQAVKRNFPIIGRFRYIFESIRPEINQYFVESNTDGRPFSREQRSLVYQRAKKQLDTLPFGTQKDLYEVGYEWVNHSMRVAHVETDSLRCTIGEGTCKKPYNASLLNISAMSYGALSTNAILALNGGAKDGHFAHNTGEGGISPYHLKPGGDLIWQIGTGYFGCRNEDGTFNMDKFIERASLDIVKMIEIKISQGAKPGHGGILPAGKVTEEIARIRGVPVGKDVLSPPNHSAFESPIELIQFIEDLREASGGKPVGFKFCLGKRREFLAIVKAMYESGITPDFITVDGGEGGTGAAPLEFSNHIGSPGVESLIFVHNSLMGFNLRDKVKVITSGKVNSAFDMIKRMALGADMIYSARAMMLALGCIQALRCNRNSCPVGVATQDPYLVAGLEVGDKRRRVASFHRETLLSFSHILGAMGLKSSDDLRPWHIMRRVTQSTIKNYSDLHEYIEPGTLIHGPIPKSFERVFAAASPATFDSINGKYIS